MCISRPPPYRSSKIWSHSAHQWWQWLSGMRRQTLNLLEAVTAAKLQPVGRLSCNHYGNPLDERKLSWLDDVPGTWFNVFLHWVIEIQLSTAPLWFTWKTGLEFAVLIKSGRVKWGSLWPWSLPPGFGALSHTWRGPRIPSVSTLPWAVVPRCDAWGFCDSCCL